MKTANQIMQGDVVSATLETQGRQLACVQAGHFSNMQEIIAHATRVAGTWRGIARLLVRNRTQGWVVSMPLARA